MVSDSLVGVGQNGRCQRDRKLLIPAAVFFADGSGVFVRTEMQRVEQIAIGLGATRVEVERLAETGDRFLEFSCGQKGVSQVDMCCDKAWFQFQRFAKTNDRLVHLPLSL